jgi:hypothetical protein
MSGNLLLSCLYTAAVAGNISDMMRFWIVGKLKDIAETMGIRNALGMVRVLSEKREITVVRIITSLYFVCSSKSLHREPFLSCDPGPSLNRQLLILLTQWETETGSLEPEDEDAESGEWRRSTREVITREEV